MRTSLFIYLSVKLEEKFKEFIKIQLISDISEVEFLIKIVFQVNM